MKRLVLPLLALSVLVLCLANLLWGSLHIPTRAVWQILWGEGDEWPTHWRLIVLESRLPQMLTALLCGASLGTAGLLLQTAFRNPLAGPSILGIDAGASLGVATVVLALGTAGAWMQVGAALMGALMVMALLIALGSVLRGAVMLLVVGILVSHVAGACISLLNFWASQSGVHAFVMWGMGSFGGVSLQRLPLFATLCGTGLLLALMLAKPLNGLLLGERYAANLGIAIRPTRLALLLCTGVLTAACTAFCGPIAFVGLAVPHLARLGIREADHRTLLPATMLVGACLALLCNLATTLPAQGGVLPVNVVTPLLGAPVVLYVILKKK